MRASVLGFGCRLSASETEAMRAALTQAGWEPTAPEFADLVVINGCTITHEADRDAAAAIRRVHRHNPSARIVVTGCYAASSAAQASALPGVVAVVDNEAKPDIVGIAAGVREHVGVPDVTVGQLRARTPLRVLPPVADARARALLKVQDGCDYRCSFCIVPAVRGASRSLPADEIASRVRDLVKAGVAEIVVTGVHLGTWGRDLGLGRGALAGLVRRLLPELGDARLRLSSVDPHELDDALLELVATRPRQICRHLHLPVQSCDDGVLGRMRRAHRVQDFVKVVERAIALVPQLAVSTDVIAGFPGEDDDAARQTHAVLSSLPLAYMHVFPYSVRRGTAAATMPHPVSPAAIAARAAELRALSQRQAQRFRQACYGHLLDVVVHRQADRHGVWWGRTDHDVAVRVPQGAAWAGRRVQAQMSEDGEQVEIVV